MEGEGAGRAHVQVLSVLGEPVWVGRGRDSVSQLTLSSSPSRRKIIPSQGWDGKVFIRATWLEMGTLWASRHTVALCRKARVEGVYFLKASTSCILRDHRGILLLITVIIIVIILLFLLTLPLLMSREQNKYLSPQMPYSRER